MKRIMFAALSVLSLISCSGQSPAAADSSAEAKNVHFSLVCRYRTGLSDASGPDAPAWVAALKKKYVIDISVVRGTAADLAKNPEKYFGDQSYLLSVWWFIDKLKLTPSAECVIVCKGGKKVKPVLVQTQAHLDAATGDRNDLLFKLEKDDIAESFQTPKAKISVHMARPEGLSEETLKGPWVVTKEQPL